MMEMSKQLLELATITVERMLKDGEIFAPIEATGFYVHSSEQTFAGFTPLHAIDVAGKRFFIAWES